MLSVVHSSYLEIKRGNMKLLNTFAVFLVIGFAATALPREAAASNATVNKDDGKCHCLTEVTLNVPPCTCSGMTETVHENIKLKERVKELQENCPPLTSNISVSYYSKHKIIEGIRWTAFWWYIPDNGWPSGINDVLGVPYGACSSSDSYCFGRLPGALEEADSELLAYDSSGTIYSWHFDPNNPTAHAVWNAFYRHQEYKNANSRTWDPHVINGPTPNAAQDSFMYRLQSGVRSVMLDDDNCDCKSTLSMGHNMCGTTAGSQYGPSRYGVDTLYDTYCQTPDPKHGLALYFRDDDDCASTPCAPYQECIDGVNTYTCIGY